MFARNKKAAISELPLFINAAIELEIETCCCRCCCCCRPSWLRHAPSASAIMVSDSAAAARRSLMDLWTAPPKRAIQATEHDLW